MEPHRGGQLDLTFDGGTTWTAGVWNNGGGLSPHDNFYSFGSIDLTSYAAANDNPNFGFRIVSIFSPQAFNQNSSVSHLANEAYMRPTQRNLPTCGGNRCSYGLV